MSTIQKVLLFALTAVLITVAITTWGSIGSAAMVLCLLLMGVSLLYQKFLTNRDSNDFDMEQ